VISLSFDTDRMDEARMREFLEHVPVPGRGTFFCTQPYACLSRTDHELAPHAYLGTGNDWDTELEEKRRQFPDATGWRSHSCVFSHILAERITRMGYRYVSVHDEPGVAAPQPVRHAWGLWHLPVYYMDNLDFSAQRFWDDGPPPFDSRLIGRSLNDDGLYVWAFHPIHIMLNSPNAEEYFERREAFSRGEPAASLRYDGYGTADFYRELCDAMTDAGLASIPMRVALANLVGDETMTSAPRR
jgi:hypothetical protein